MELTISVSDKIANILMERAKNNGRDVREFVAEIVEEKMLAPTLDELLAPVRQEVKDKNLSEDELDDFMYSIRQKVREERKNPDKA
ncbi:MAG: hypothetical protein ACR2J3_11070 [Aridibacter sp.]